VFEQIGDLEDRSVAGIAKVADERAISSDATNNPIIREARELIGRGKGEWIYTGTCQECKRLKWSPPAAGR
jgi:hypothetical protein